MNKEIDLKEDTINIKEEEVHVFENQVERAQKTIDVNNVKIKKLNQKHEIQILTIDSYDVTQLEQFFTNRYRDSSSIK
jgi:hypothetical protein